MKNIGVDAIQHPKGGNLSFELEIWADFHSEEEIINKQLYTDTFWTSQHSEIHSWIFFKKRDVVYMLGIRIFKFKDPQKPTSQGETKKEIWNGRFAFA